MLHPQPLILHTTSLVTGSDGDCAPITQDIQAKLIQFLYFSQIQHVDIGKQGLVTWKVRPYIDSPPVPFPSVKSPPALAHCCKFCRLTARLVKDAYKAVLYD